jgi:hypothetical protein
MKTTRTFQLLWLILLIINLVFNFFIMPGMVDKIKENADYPAKVKILDITFTGFNPEKAKTFLEAMGEKGRSYYVVMLTREDGLYPIAYGALLMLTLFMLIRNRPLHPGRKKLILALPVLIMAADYVENHHIVRLIQQFPEISATTHSVTTIAFVIKWAG